MASPNSGKPNWMRERISRALVLMKPPGRVLKPYAKVLMCLEGKSIEKWHELPLPVITNDNLDQFVRMDCPDDLWSNTQMSPEVVVICINAASKLTRSI